MQKTLIELESLRDAIGTLRSSRPNELDTDIIGFEGINYQAIEEMLAYWKRGIGVMASSKWIDSSTSNLFDNVLSQQLKEVLSAVTQANSNGSVWLISSSGFPAKAAAITQTIEQLSNRRGEASKQFAKALNENTLEQAQKISAAAQVAGDLEAKSKEADDVLAGLNSTSNSAMQAAEELGKAVESLVARKDEIEAARTETLEARSVSAETAGEIAKLMTESTKTVDAFDLRLADLDRNLEEALKASSDATESLRTALVDVKKKGLAEAFASRAARSNSEKGIWILAFAAAVIGLVVSAQSFAADITDLSYQSLLVALLRRAAIAAPSVWLGWYAAKQIGRLNRVIEDYEYKAATALTFEAYKKEIEINGDRELLQELLKTTISNFGDNPVRLLSSDPHTPATPTEEVLDSLLKDSLFQKLAKVSRLFRPGT